MWSEEWSIPRCGTGVTGAVRTWACSLLDLLWHIKLIAPESDPS